MRLTGMSVTENTTLLVEDNSDAAKEIKALIGNAVKKVGSGTRQVENAGKTMGEIVASVEKVTAIIDQITCASREQASGIEQVNQAVGQMDQVVQQNAAVVDQAAAAAESMQGNAQQLYQAVSVFKLNDIAPAHATAPVHAQSTAPSKHPRDLRALRVTSVALALALSAAANSADGKWKEF